MIRVNLLKARGGPGERIQAVLNPGGPSAFISKREVILAGLFVVLGCVILATQLRLGDSSEEEAAGASDSPQVLLRMLASIISAASLPESTIMV